MGLGTRLLYLLNGRVALAENLVKFETPQWHKMKGQVMLLLVRKIVDWCLALENHLNDLLNRWVAMSGGCIKLKMSSQT